MQTTVLDSRWILLLVALFGFGDVSWLDDTPTGNR